MEPKLELYGVEITYPFDERAVLNVVRSEIEIKRALEEKGLSDSRVLEEVQIMAKSFYTELQALYGREKVDEFIRLFTVLQIKYLEHCEFHDRLGHMGQSWLHATLTIALVGNTLIMSFSML